MRPTKTPDAPVLKHHWILMESYDDDFGWYSWRYCGVCGAVLNLGRRSDGEVEIHYDGYVSPWECEGDFLEPVK